MRARFPSAEDDTPAHPLPVDGRNGALVNQDHYDRATAKNLLSDIARYEVLMMYGGVYMDADSECFRPIDHLLFEAPVAQAFGFLEKDKSYHGALVGSSVIGSHPFSPLTVALRRQHTFQGHLRYCCSISTGSDSGSRTGSFPCNCICNNLRV